MSSTRIDVQDSGAQTATAQGGSKAVGNITDLGVFVEATIASGTCSIWIQASSDGGTTWYDLPYELVLTSDPTAATPSVAAVINDRNILSEINAVASAFAKYRNFGDLVRAAWYIAGSGATFTFSVKGIGKT